MVWAWSHCGPLCPQRENLPEDGAENSRATKGSRAETRWHHLSPQSNWFEATPLLGLSITLANKFLPFASSLEVNFWHLQLNELHYIYIITTYRLYLFQRRVSLGHECTTMLSTGETIYWTHNINRLKEYISTPERFHGSPDLLNPISTMKSKINLPWSQNVHLSLDS